MEAPFDLPAYLSNLPQLKNLGKVHNYRIPMNFFLYNILTGGERFEDVIEQQVLMAEHGIDFEYTDNITDLEREIIFNHVLKREKDKMDFEIEKFKAYAKIFGAKVENAG